MIYMLGLQLKELMVFIPNREELAWAAGFFDGDGCFHCGSRITNERQRAHILAIIDQKDPQVLKKFKNAVSFGRINGPNKIGMWRYSIANFEGFQAVGAMLWAFLSPIKREQFTAALKKYHTYPRGID